MLGVLVAVFLVKQLNTYLLNWLVVIVLLYSAYTMLSKQKEEALEIYSEGKAKVPLRTNIDIDEKNGQNLYMPAYVGGNQAAAGLKIVSVYPDNISKGLPSVPATVITLDADTGELGR